MPKTDILPKINAMFWHYNDKIKLGREIVMENN